MKSTPQFLKLQIPWSITIILFSVISRTVVGRVVHLCKDVASAFYSPSWLGQVLFQAIQLSISIQFSSIWPIDRTLSSATTPGQSGPGSDGNEEVLHIPQSSRFTGASPSDCLVSYPGHLGELYLFAEMQSVYSTALADWALTIVALFQKMLSIVTIHHHVMPLAQISLTLSRHFSLSFISSGRSSRLHPVSSHSCCMYVLAGHPAFARPYVGVHRSTSLMSSSLLLQQCPACLVRLIGIVFVMGGRWPYK